MMKDLRSLTIFKILISVWVVFHLLCVFITPNSLSHLGVRFQGILSPYMNTLALSNSWNFFAPEPGPPPTFLDWELINSRGEVVSTGRLPDTPDPFFLRERQNRRITLSRFLLSDTARIDRMLIPYLCRKHSEISSVRVWHTVLRVRELGDLTQVKMADSDRSLEKKFLLHSFCEKIT